MRTQISELVFTAAAQAKLERRRIAPEEVRDLLWNDYRVLVNPTAPQRDRRYLIGQTNGGRFLTIVIESTVEPTTWLVITGWEATSRQRRLLGSER